MYFPYFIAYILIGLTISLALFYWALRNGQFQDQQRARFLPLRDEIGTAPPMSITRTRRWEVYGLFILAAGGLAVSAAVLIMAIYCR